MKARLPSAVFTFFPGAGHSIHRTKHKEFDRCLREIIAATAREDPSA